MKIVRKVFWGLFFIIAAALIVVSQLGYLAGISLFTLVASIFLAAIFIESLAHINFTGMMFSLAFVGILYAVPLGITALTPWPILAVALLLSIGLTIIFGGPHYHHCHFDEHCNMNGNHNNHMETCEEVGSTEDGIVNIKTNMTGTIKYINTDNLKIVNIDSSFAGVKVYLDQAKIQGDSAEVNVNASFSGVELYVPREWKIVNNVVAVMGGIDEKNKSSLGQSNTENNKTIILNGTCKLSGIEIIYM